MFRRGRWAAALLLTATGCVGDDLRTPLKMPLVPEDGPAPRQTTAKPVAMSRAPAADETTKRVVAVAGRLIEANEAVGLRPFFVTIGVPAPEVFHRGTAEVVITEGLVRRCDDEQLAGVLSLELGKMASEREALTAPEVRVGETAPPLDVSSGHDADPLLGTADGTGRVEQVLHERQRRQAERKSYPPAPEALARQFLKQARYKPEALDAAAPLLREAENNSTQERNWTGGQLPSQAPPHRE